MLRQYCTVLLFAFCQFFIATATLADADESRRLPIQSVSLTSSNSLPDSVAAEENRDRLLAFDRDTSTALTLYDEATLDVALEGTQTIQSLKIFGAAPYRLEIFTSTSGKKALQKEDLTKLGDGWNTITLSSAVIADNLRLVLVPRNGSSASGLGEVEFWGPDKSVANALLTAMDLFDLSGGLGQWRTHDFAIADDIAVISPAGGDDPLAVQSLQITTNIPYLATEIRRAWLNYELKGDASVISLQRSLNGFAGQGGYPFQPDTNWTEQLEPIDPTQLVQGENTLALAIGENASALEIQNVRLVVELAQGAKLAGDVALDPLLDGDADTVLSYGSGDSTIAAAIEKRSQIDQVSLSFASAGSGLLEIEALQDGQWGVVTEGPVDLSGLVSGDTLSVPVTVHDATQVRVKISNADISYSLSELAIHGSELGTTWGDTKLNVTWPVTGQNYGEIAVVRGYISQPRTEEGAAQLFVADLPVPMAVGAFEAVVSREQAGYGGTDLSTPWAVNLRLVRPDGTLSETNVHMGGIVSPTGNDGFLPEPTVDTVSRDAASVLTNDGAVLEIDQGSVAQDTDISITPLLDAELARLDLGLTNVTRGQGRGYRMLPHMQFQKKIKIKLDYDDSLIPEGYSQDDINIYFFDTESGRWIALQGAERNGNSKWIRAETDHFTDFIAGVVVAPESPQTASFNPTQIQGIKAADPTAKINLVQAPTANSSGDANISYPIELPAGRLGLAPSLQVGYNSAGGNGWMGLGWNLSTPEISIDTRWGVPRYDDAFETETYSFNGQMLTPVAHRAALIPREADREFHTRIEGGFQKIIRHGNNPANYWFEVVDKMGTRYAYGGDLDTGAIDVSAALLTDGGDVFRWKLTEVRDTNGNFVSYDYSKVASTGLKNGSNLGKNIYPERISYTGHNGVEGAYEVLFTRDRELPGFAERRDTIIDGRGGFKQVTADLLRHIEVRLNGTPIRAYEFTYTEGAYYKSLLQSATQYGADGAAFNTHTFDYHDDTRQADGSYKGFAQKVTWDVPGGDVSDVSVLQGANTDSVGGFGLIGLSLLVPSVENAVLNITGKFGANKSDTEHLISLIDINGDGLADKVYKDGGAVYYRRNLSGPQASGMVAFAASPTLVANLSDIGGEKYRGSNKTVELFILRFNASLTWSDGTAESQIYFSDVNGDGLVDLVNGAIVLFNSITSTGDPSFAPDVTLTPYPIPDSATSVDALDIDLSETLAAIEASAPLIDTVVVWEAPFDGAVQVTSDVALLETTDPERASYESADGVRVAIQLEGAEVWSDTLAETDYATRAANVGPLTVARGDKVYFRVQSNYDGAFDEVSWAPVIEYVGADLTATDSNSLPIYAYDYATDFTTFGFGNGIFAASKDGTVQVSGTLTKTTVTTDDVTLELLLNGSVIDSHTFAAGDTGSYSLSESLMLSAAVIDTGTGTVTQAADTVQIRLSNDSRIDASALAWDAADTPTLVYTAFDDGSSVTDGNGDPAISVDLYGTINLFAGSDFVNAAEAWVVPQDGVYMLTPELDLMAAAPDGEVTLTLKSNVSRLAKETVTIVSGVATAATLQLALVAGTEIWIEYSDVTGNYADAITQARLRVELPDPADTVAPIDNLIDEIQIAELHSTKVTPRTGEAYRGWSRLGYDGTDAAQPITISDADLEMPDQAELEALGDDIQASAESGEVNDSLRDSVDQKIYTFVPDYSSSRWNGPEDQVFAAAATLGSSRLNLDFPEVPDPMEFAGARGVPQISTTSERNIGLGFAYVQANQAKSVSRSVLDYQDLNGDSFPDVLSQGAKVQYTRMLGHLDTLVSAVPNMENNPRVTRAVTTSIGGSKPGAKGNANGNNAATGAGGVNTSLTIGEIRGAVGFSATISSGDSETDHDLRDMNGDGLSDIVKQNGDQLTVRYNIGYSFLPNYEALGATGLNLAVNSSFGVGVGFNSGGNSISAGGNLADSSSRVLESLNDINGDGLTDAVHVGSDNNLVVYLNSGSGFETPIDWATGGLGSEFAETDGKSIGLGGSFTACPGFLIYFCVGAGLNAGDSTSWTLVRISDLNGDGDPDLLRSNDDGELRASYGTDGRTNMLRSVNRPLGSTIATDYTRSGNTYDQPSNKWVLARVEVYDGFEGDGSDTLVSTFAYADGNYDRQEREFYGYATVTENHLNYVSAGNESVYRTITTTYDNDSYYSKGLMLSSVTTDADGNLFLQTDNTYAYRNIDTNAAADLASLTATVFPQLVRTDKAFFEGQGTAGKETYTTFAYDDLGNVTRFYDAANLDTSSDDVESLIAYHSDVPNYIVGKADSVVVNGNGAEMRRRTATFETGTGNLLEVASINTGGIPSVTTLAYDARGNLSQVQGAENLNGQRYTLDYTFDPIVQTYVTATTDSFGYTSAAEYDFRFGEVIGTTDINAQSITNTLDEFGRVVTITGPYQTSDATITFAYNPRLDVPNSPEAYPAVDLSWALTQHIDTYRDLSDPIETVLFADGLGRVLQTKKDATLYNGTTYTDQMVASGRVNFDFVGRQIEQYYPVAEGLGSQGIFNPSYDSVAPTTTTYDILDRPLTITIPDGASTQMAYGFGPDRAGQTQFQTVFTDAEGKMRETFADVRGLMTSVKEINPTGGQPTIWTSYEYDPLKQITLVTDDQGNQTTSAYDNLGRQIAIDSPDMGLTEFTYDPASNLIAKQTANLAAAGQQINYAYDFGRLMGVNYPQFSGNDISYTYGAPGASDNRANRIVTVASQAGLEERFYGPLGETVKTIMTVSSDTGANPEVYATEYTYDTWNRLQTMTYPDGEILVNAYDSGGKLEQIDGTKAGYNYPYLKEMGYDKFGQRVFIRLGNDTTTTYAYTAETRRLNALQTQSDQTGRQFQDMTYGYDLVGNILSQANLAENTVNNLLGGATSYTYEYDDLYRLTAATGSWSAPNNPESFTLAMSYDRIHNIASKTQEHLVVDRVQGKTSYDWTYGYNGAQPHAPTDIGDRTYSYDANGNQTGWESNVNGTNRTIVWDEENRIQSVADNGATTTYKYNDAGERIFKVGAQGETVYVNQFYVIRNGQVASKHIFGGSQRLVSKLASQPVDAPTTDGAAANTNAAPAPAAAPAGNGSGKPKNPNAGGANSQGQGSGAGGVNGGGGGNAGGGTGGGGNTGGGGGQPQEERTFYFYHPDHLGSSSYVTDIDGEVFQHVEYFPFGETWVEEHSNRQRTPYLFTGKELDEDTQLYYFGARYYDPRTSVWQSPDPILASYLIGENNNGVFETRNLALFSYAGQNPIRYTDPDGNCWSCDTQNDWDMYNAEQADTNFSRADTIRNGGGINWVRRGLGSQNVYEQRGQEYASRIGVPSGDQGMSPEMRDTLGAGLMMMGMRGSPRPDGSVNLTARRTGPVGVVAGRHNANVMVRDANGNIVTHTRLVSGNQTPTELALGFPRGSLASHTEARAVSQIPLRRGDTMVITGQRPPCPSCKGYMNRAANEQGATIQYQWRQNGQTQTWFARPSLE